jgi:hypothetical protein
VAAIAATPLEDNQPSPRSSATLKELDGVMNRVPLFSLHTLLL